MINPSGANLIPLPYRQVSVQRVTWPIDQKNIAQYLAGKDCYKATRFIIFKNGPDCAVVQVAPGAATTADGLFCEVEGHNILALPSECIWIEDPLVDTGNRHQLAEAAHAKCILPSQTLIVEGAFGHVNFYHRPNPLTLRVIDQVPPSPSRLVSLVRQALAFDDFPALIIQENPIDLVSLAQKNTGSGACMFPCHASGLKGPAGTFFLDDRPPLESWTLYGCERTEQIYRHTYSADPHRVDTCPRKSAEKNLSGKTILRCCLLESTIEVNGDLAVVPWGANPDHVLQALRQLLGTGPRAS